jgi:hypothetical protein
MNGTSMSSKKASVKLLGTDGNVFALLGRCTSSLKKAGQHEAARELAEKVMAAHSYDEALVVVMMEYVDVY